MALSTKDMIKWTGRAVFFALLLIQWSFLTAYPGKYKHSAWYAIVVAYVPVASLWIGLLVRGKTDLRQFFLVWLTYVYCALFPNIVVIFGFVVDNLDKNEFLSPNVLKMVLCITPLLLLLLLTTADFKDDGDDEAQELRWKLITYLSIQITIDFLDTVEMLDIVLDEKKHNYGISKEFGIKTIAVACFSLLQSPWQMAEVKFKDGKPEKPNYKVTMIRTTAELIGVNSVFLIVRLIVFFKYGKDESIFIAKNGIAIILSLFEIYYFDRSHRKKKREEAID